MDGRNSTGRKVSLLNDTCSDGGNRPVPPAFTKLPSLARLDAQYRLQHQFARSPSSESTSSSPQTPPLIRSDSTDSARALPSPSPLTPQSTSFEQPLKPAKQVHSSDKQHWSNMDDSLYPPMADNLALGTYLPPLTTTGPPLDQPRQMPSDSPISDSRVSNASAADIGKLPMKKSLYPCPLAAQYKCNDHFTTSGHAARHAKKHTGRKDAICPECNKAFTRKDNMEQHRRTHQNVRGPSTKASGDKVKKSTKAARKGDRGIPTAPLEAAVADLVEEQEIQPALAPAFPLVGASMQPAMLGEMGGPYFMSAEPVAALPHPIVNDFAGRPPLYRSNYTSSLDFTTAITPTMGDPSDLHFTYPSPGLSNGLNTLALVASDHSRRSEEEATSSSSSSTTPPALP